MEVNNKQDPKLAFKHDLWSRGVLSWKLDKCQKELYNLFYNSNHKIQTWLLSRRNGKTYTLVVLALEQCLRKPNSIVKFVSPTKTQLNNIVRPLFRTILDDCPDKLKPEFKTKDYIYYFANGSEIQLAGTDGGHAEKLRGGDSDIFFVDEAGSCSDLDNVVKSILLPTTLITKGKGVLASTPPKESDHDFLKFIEEADMRGSLIKKTIDDNPRITQEQKDELIKELGGAHTTEARRELYCEIVKDSNSSVIPEFTPELQKEITKEWPRPPFYDGYVSMDIGFKDLTVALFGYYDFRADKVIIEDELVVNFQNPEETIKKLGENILEKEAKIFINPISLEIQKPTMRVSDINYIVIQELNKSTLGKLNFQNASKDDNDSALNVLRQMFSSRKIIINPKCEILLRHLKNVKWQKNKTKFARSPDDGHYDAVDALKYMIRAIQYYKNPYPAHYNLNPKDLFVRTPERFGSNNQLEIYKRVFNVKPKRKF